MKLLVATHITQGNGLGDYCWAVDGELVTPLGLVCSNSQCGCERGFPGLASSSATTTAMVVDLAHIGRAELETAVHDSLLRGGWLTGGVGSGDLDDIFDDDELDELDELDDDDGDLTDEEFIAAHVDAIIKAAGSFPIGSILCRSRDTVFARQSLAA